MPSANTLQSYQQRTSLKSLQGAGPLVAQDVTGGRISGERQQSAALFKALEGVGEGALGIYKNWLETKVLGPVVSSS